MSQQISSTPILVALHGWAGQTLLWQDWLQSLQPDFQVIPVELPGHGHQVENVPKNHQAWLDWLAQSLPQEPHILLGWSLGGILAQGLMAQNPQRFLGFVGVATTAKFAATPDWPGVATEHLAAFVAELENQPAALLKRFQALMVKGNATELRQLTQAKKNHNLVLPSPQALAQGLSWLVEADYRHSTQILAQSKPFLWLLGEEDALIPCQLHDHLPGEIHLFAAAHLPFYSQSEALNQTLRAWYAQNFKTSHSSTL